MTSNRAKLIAAVDLAGVGEYRLCGVRQRKVSGEKQVVMDVLVTREQCDQRRPDANYGIFRENDASPPCRQNSQDARIVAMRADE